ncbi:MAG: multidrug transporter, partial [Acidimicrobiia bacterium]|nr:multidrug transporter [Acidimicrobiia bacterium]
SLLTLGRLTDRIGRRPSLVAGIAISAVSSLAFAGARSVAWLFAGELIYGVAAGLVMSSAAVAIRELHPKQSAAGGALASSVAAAAGLTVGPLLSGILATVTPWPTVSVYVLHIGLALALAAALLRIPETKPNHPAPARRAPVFHVPAGIRPEFAATALAGAAGWMVVGWVLGLSPSFLHEELNVHVTRPVVAGLFAALVLLCGGTSQLLLRRYTSVASLRSGLVAMTVGLAVIASSAQVNSLPVALAGAVITGAGAGMVQMNTMVTVLRIAPIHARGGVTSAFLTVCYVAMSLPVLIAGFSADRLGLQVVTNWYLVAVVVLVAVAIVASQLVVPEADDLLGGPAVASAGGGCRMEPAS